MRALVIYGTRWGGTAGIAQRIGQSLRNEGYTVDVLDAKKSPKNIDAYELVIVGSGIRADKWTKETLNFLEKTAPVLRTKRTALFVSCQMADRTDEAHDKAKNQYLKETAECFGLKPVAFGFFGGFLDFSKSHGLFVDILVRVNRNSLRKNGLDTQRVRDTRDWVAIELWTRGVVAAANL